MPHFWLMDELSTCPHKYDHLLPFSERSSNNDDSAEFSAQKLKRRVRFDDSNKPVIHSVLGKQQMSSEERKNKWYTKSEFEQIWRRSSDIVLRRASSSCSSSSSSNCDYQNDNDDLPCIRGLEHRLKKNKLRRRTMKTNAINAVLSEQDRQRHSIISTTSISKNTNSRKSASALQVKEIRQIYREYSKPCVADAIRQGLVDQREVRCQCDVPKRRGGITSTSVDIKGLVADAQDVLKELSTLDILAEDENKKRLILQEDDGEEEEELSLEDLVSKAPSLQSSQTATTFFSDDNLDDFHDSVFNLGSDEFSLFNSPKPSCSSYGTTTATTISKAPSSLQSSQRTATTCFSDDNLDEFHDSVFHLGGDGFQL